MILYVIIATLLSNPAARGAIISPEEYVVNNAALRQHVGVLLEHGQAPYKNDPKAKQSYFVRLRTEGGATETVWGIDLERAIAESGKSVGEGICLTYLGSRTVKVEAIQKDDAGNAIGVEEIETERNEWKVEPWSPTARHARDILGAAPAGKARHVPAFPSWRSLLGGSSPANLLGPGGVARLADSVKSNSGSIAEALSEHRSLQAIRTFQSLLDEAEKSISTSNYGNARHAQSDANGVSPFDESTAKLIRERVQALVDFAGRAAADDSNLGLSKEQLANDMVLPLREFKDNHEQLLKEITDQGQSLYQIIEGALRNLLNFIRSLFRKADTIPNQDKGPSN